MRGHAHGGEGQKEDDEVKGLPEAEKEEEEEERLLSPSFSAGLKSSNAFLCIFSGFSPFVFWSLNGFLVVTLLGSQVLSSVSAAPIPISLLGRSRYLPDTSFPTPSCAFKFESVVSKDCTRAEDSSML